MGNLIRNHYVKNIAIFCLLGPLVGGMLFSISIETLTIWDYSFSLDAPNLALIEKITEFGYEKFYFARMGYQFLPAALLTGFSASLLPQERNSLYIFLVSAIGFMSCALQSNVMINEHFTTLPAFYGFLSSVVCALLIFSEEVVPMQEEINRFIQDV